MVQRAQIITPIFNGDGTVEIKTTSPDPELADLVEKVFLSLGNLSEGAVIVTQETFQAFMRMVRSLILTNYNMTSEEMANLLTMSISQFADFYQLIQLHIRTR